MVFWLEIVIVLRWWFIFFIRFESILLGLILINVVMFLLISLLIVFLKCIGEYSCLISFFLILFLFVMMLVEMFEIMGIVVFFIL